MNWIGCALNPSKWSAIEVCLIRQMRSISTWKRRANRMISKVINYNLTEIWLKSYLTALCIAFCQITTLTQTHRSELVRSTSPQDRIYGFMPTGNISSDRLQIIAENLCKYLMKLGDENNINPLVGYFQCWSGPRMHIPT